MQTPARKAKTLKVKTPLQQRLTRAGVTYDDVALEAGVSWFMVWAVLNRRRVSARVIEAAERLLRRGLPSRAARPQ